jgi:hypothetical protein
MQKYLRILVLVGIIAGLVTGCDMSRIDPGFDEVSGARTLAEAGENDQIIIPESAYEPAPETRWTEYSHRSLSSIAASQWGLSTGRAANISDASDDPDTYQSGLDNGYNQQWSHAYIFDDWFGSVFYLWGDANEDCRDNLNGPTGGEGYNGQYAGYYYTSGNQYQGDRYIGYALHYIEDVSLTLHSTAPTSLGVTVPYYTVDMITNHFNFETWVQNNMYTGHRLMDAVSGDYNYYAVTDPSQALINAAWASCSYKGTSSIGYLAWKEYRNCGYPTASGSGNATLVENTKKMLISAGRYAKGIVKYALDRYGQWTSGY